MTNRARDTAGGHCVSPLKVRKVAILAVYLIAAYVLAVKETRGQNSFSPPLSVPPSFYGLQWQTNSFNARNAILSAGITVAINMEKAEVAVLTGQLRPVASYTASPAVASKAEGKLLEEIGTPDARDSSRAARVAELNAGYQRYLADAREAGEQPNNVVTACAYYAVTALEVEHARQLTGPERRAVRGDCVALLGSYQQGLHQFVSDGDRQYATLLLATIAGVAARQYAAAAPDQRDRIKASMEKGFNQFFGLSLSQVPVDHLSCAGARTQEDFKECNQVPNERLAAVAENTR